MMRSFKFFRIGLEFAVFFHYWLVPIGLIRTTWRTGSNWSSKRLGDNSALRWASGKNQRTRTSECWERERENIQPESWKNHDSQVEKYSNRNFGGEIDCWIYYVSIERCTGHYPKRLRYDRYENAYQPNPHESLTLQRLSRHVISNREETRWAD